MQTRFSSRPRADLLALAVLSLLAAGACGSDSGSNDAGAGGRGGSGGSAGSGGRGGSGGTGGTSGSGGSGGATGGGGGTSATGGTGGGGASGGGGSGTTGGSGGSGGASGGGGGASGGGGTGGGGTGGTGGGGGSGGAGGTGGTGGGTQDARMETAADVPAGGGNTIESCFANLRAGMGSYQIGTKTSADGKVRYRLALETADRFGTSGTKPWGAYRFAIESPSISGCVTQSGLFNAYKTSHHNCMDSFEVNVGARRVRIQAPDFDGNRAARVTVTEANIVLIDNVQVLPTACTGSTTPCRSGGPC